MKSRSDDSWSDEIRSDEIRSNEIGSGELDENRHIGEHFHENRKSLTTLIPDSCWQVARAQTMTRGSRRSTARNNWPNVHFFSFFCIALSARISSMSSVTLSLPRKTRRAAQSINKSINQSISQSVSRSDRSQSVNQSILDKQVLNRLERMVHWSTYYTV